jgi:hypothetical protein
MIDSTLRGLDDSATKSGNGMSRVGPELVRGSDAGPLSRQYKLALDTESDERVHELLRALPVGVYTTDAAGRITFFNETAAAMWGRRPELNNEKVVQFVAHVLARRHRAAARRMPDGDRNCSSLPQLTRRLDLCDWCGSASQAIRFNDCSCLQSVCPILPMFAAERSQRLRPLQAHADRVVFDRLWHCHHRLLIAVCEVPHSTRHISLKVGNHYDWNLWACRSTAQAFNDRQGERAILLVIQFSRQFVAGR